MISSQPQDVTDLLHLITRESRQLDRTVYQPDSTIIHVYKEFAPQLGLTTFNILGLYLRSVKVFPYNHTVDHEEFIDAALADDTYTPIYVLLNIMKEDWETVLRHDPTISDDQRKEILGQIKKDIPTVYKSWDDYDNVINHYQNVLDTIVEVAGWSILKAQPSSETLILPTATSPNSSHPQLVS